ncbi:MAG: glucosamine-6-phosphate deaminase [Spirochaetaceae bacterium]|jgi:glucosamine-6-phosphate deaminase|nr:glucosamine-6-phosphate deaminase [Spirochaetaceae bacterium]
MKFIVTENFSESSRVAARMFLKVIDKNPGALLGCATGESTLGIYGELVKEHVEKGLDFSRTRTVNLDEYQGLDRAHPRSFSFFMEKNFFSQVNIQSANCYLINGAGDGEEELAAFNSFLERNTIDALMLGLGSNGHIGFNEPDDVFVPHARLVQLSDETRNANSRFFDNKDETPRYAFTMGMKDIVKARKIILIASGKSKAWAVKTLRGCHNADPHLPCSILRLCSDAAVIVDKELYNMAAES